MKLHRAAVALATLPFLLFCAGPEGPDDWRAPDYEAQGFGRLFVIGVGEDSRRRIVFEDRFVAALERRELAGSPSHDLLSETRRIRPERVRAAIIGGDYDGVLVARLMGTKESILYRAGDPTSLPASHHAIYDFYRDAWTKAHEPGYLDRHGSVKLETNLYDARSGALVWTGVSEEFDPAAPGHERIEAVIEAVIAKLDRQRLLE